jgi:hypothetical protein
LDFFPLFCDKVWQVIAIVLGQPAASTFCLEDGFLILDFR